jgi:mycothiol synthase
MPGGDARDPGCHAPGAQPAAPVAADAGSTGVGAGSPGAGASPAGLPGLVANAGAAELSVRGRLSEPDAAAVLALVRAATEEDGVGPLSEHVMLHLRYGGDPRARNVLLGSRGELAGYAHLDPTDPVEGPSGELVIHPAHRGKGLGLTLVRALAAAAGQQPLRLWAHGDLPAATRLAAAAGFERVRALWQMRRSLQAKLDRPEVPDGITIRTFVVGRDEDPWLAVNHAAFARHPEQGAWTRADLELREQEPWFDPDGFFLAERDGKVVGFHWTKVHGRSTGQPPRDDAQPASRDAQPASNAVPPTDGPGKTPPTVSGAGQAVSGAGQAVSGAGQAGHGHEPIGEVYVVGVDPAERGSGLGRALTVIGLRYLRSLGLFQVMLYVDETNTAAIRLYESLGFTHWDTDVMFANLAGQAVHGRADRDTAG